MSIVIESVSKAYGSQLALDGVSFEAKPGEIVGFLGPNGAGKSTMMKIITGFIPATEGVATVCGLNVSENPIKIKNKIGYLAEQNPLYHDMFVREYLGFICGVYKLTDKKEKIDRMIKTVGLSLEQNKKIGALSKGYKQRVGLAQALIHDPEVLILDEPTTGLDPNQLEEIRGLIKKIGGEKTIMLSTHIMQEVEAICDRVIIIDKGRIVANDLTEKLSSIFSKSDNIKVEFASEVSNSQLKKIAGVLTTNNMSGNVWLIGAESGIDVRNQILKFSVEHDISILSLQKDNLKLEDIFKQLTTSSV